MGEIQKLYDHMDDLLKLSMCSEDDFHHLRMIYDRVFANTSNYVKTAGSSEAADCLSLSQGIRRAINCYQG